MSNIQNIYPITQDLHKKENLFLTEELVTVSEQVEATSSSSTPVSRRRMLATLAARQETTPGLGAADAHATPKVGGTLGSSGPNLKGTGLPSGLVPFPGDPSLPNSGCPDPSVPSNDPYNFSHTGYMNKLMAFLSYINYHPTDAQAYINFAKYVSNLSQMGLLNSDAMAYLNKAGAANLMNDGIEMAAAFAFLTGYDGKAPGMASYEAYLNALKGALDQIKGQGHDNSFIDSMLAEVNTDLDPRNIAAYQKDHVAANGDLIWTINGHTYNWSSGGDDQKFMIEQYILNFGSIGGDNSDISYLNGQIQSLMTQDLMATIDAVWATTHDPGVLILAFMQAVDGDYLNQEAGNADVMDRQHQLNQKFVNSIQSALQGINNWKSDGSGPTDAQAAETLSEQIKILIDLVQSSGQFSGLSDSMTSLVNTLKNTSISFKDPVTGKTDSGTLYDILINNKDAAGNALNGQEIAAALKQGLSPDAPTPPSPTSPPTGGGSPNTEALQGFLGAMSSIANAISSTSTQLTTLTSQIEQLHQAILKVGTGVVDPKEGLNAVTMAAVNHQISN